jgi:dihydroorotase-like cyclic amidohydrolase
MKFDTIVTGGQVATPGGVVETDIGIRDEKIAALGQDLSAEKNGATVVDASGHLVLPGIIDAHVHLELPFCGTVSSDDYRSGTRAGARGGVTTLMDFAIPYGEESLGEAVDNWHQRAEGKALIDYAFHLCITRWHEHRHQIKDSTSPRAGSRTTAPCTAPSRSCATSAACSWCTPRRRASWTSSSSATTSLNRWRSTERSCTP